MDWGIDIEKINCATKQISEYRKSLKKGFNLIIKTIANVLTQWTGKTYVGAPKEKDLQNAFQNFFVEIFALAQDIENSVHSTRMQMKFLECARYQGDLYRYIGSDSPFEQCKRVEYNEIYVSWSKAKGNSYVLSKLYNPIYLLSAKLSGEFYGFDIELFDKIYNRHFHKHLMIARGTEREVVFPTVKNAIVKIQEVKDDVEVK